jgi:hypothetical protein
VASEPGSVDPGAYLSVPGVEGRGTVVATQVSGGFVMGDGTFVKEYYCGDGGVIDTEVATGKKNADTVPEVHQGAAEEKEKPVPALADPELFEDEPRQG